MIGKPDFPLMFELLGRNGWPRTRIAKKLGVHVQTVNLWGREDTTPQMKNLLPLLGIARKELPEADYNRCFDGDS